MVTGMYEEIAPYYDAIYAWKDYGKETELLLDRLERHAPHAKTLLDVACGTGRHLELLAGEFEIEGVDASSSMLAVARQRLGDVPLHKGDMRDFDLGRRFDVVTCLFGSIALLKSLDEARAAVRNFVAHTDPGGAVVIEPWVAHEIFEDTRVDASVQKFPEGKIAMASAARREGRIAKLDMHYWISTTGQVRHLSELFEVGIWTEEEYRSLLDGEGLHVHYDREGLMGRGLLIGVRAQ
jgi:ubiquinone/menaquinone biosynthesis C-methylase UbiE